MSTNTRLVHASVDRVWNVLADGWLYPLRVVGASRMREVDDTWPAVGSSLHHSVGVWALLVDDTTEVLECAPGALTPKLLQDPALTWRNVETLRRLAFVVENRP